MNFDHNLGIRRRVLFGAAVALSLALLFGNVAMLRAQSQFPQIERLLWKSLGAWVPLVHNPISASSVPVIDDEGNPALDIFGDPLYQTSPLWDPSKTPDQNFAAAVQTLQLGECTYSNFGDWDEYGLAFEDYGSNGPRARRCLTADGVVAPPKGALLDPVALAVDDTRIYVSDNFNHRVQVFDFYGNPTELDHPIGNGVPGRGDYADPDGKSGEMLNAPEGIVVDGESKVAVADGWNQRVAVFANDGQFQFDFELPDGASGPMKPAGLAITPGAVLLDPTGDAPVGPAADHRVVVTDWTHCHVEIFDTHFGLVASLPTPENVPQGEQAQHDACWNPQGGYVTQPGQFATVTGIAVDALDRIYVADNSENVIQVFDRDGNPLGWIGKPGEQPAPGELNGPVGVMVDHLGRVAVTDGGNARVVFYSVVFATPPMGTHEVPTATFEFQLDTTVSVQDFMMGLAEQVGPRCDDPARAIPCPAGSAPNLSDPKGRFIATDPLRRRLVRFELPEMAIVNATADANTHTGSFDVVVPRQKIATVQQTTVSVNHVEAGQFIIANPAGAVDIDAGALQHYTFTYGGVYPISTFLINAKGDQVGTTGVYLASADEVSVVVREDCNCTAQHAVYVHPAPPLAAADLHGGLNGWYGTEVFVRITPDAAPAGEGDNGEVASIQWYFTGEAGQTYGTTVSDTPIGPDGYVDILDRIEGASALVYWPISRAGTTGMSVTVPLNIDLHPPEVQFDPWPSPSGVDASNAPWYNFDVTGTYVASDVLSGVKTDSLNGTVRFTTEGRDQSLPITLTDHVDHVADTSSAEASGGLLINIDKTLPIVTPPLDITRLQDGTSGFYTLRPGDNFFATADDGAGSGFNASSITNDAPAAFPIGTTTVTFSVTDYAGNSGTAIAKVTVVGRADSTVAADDKTFVYGTPISASATVLAPLSESAPTGDVTFTITAAGNPSAVYTLTTGDVGSAATVFSGLVLNKGTYTYTASYGGSGTVSGSSDTGEIKITEATVSVVADSHIKNPGDPDPSLTYTAGALLPGNSFSGALTRDPGETPGVSYPILQGTLAASANYTIHFTPGTLEIRTLSFNVFADLSTKGYGSGDPVLTYHWEPELPLGVVPSGALDRDAGENTGNYTIHQGTLSLPPGYALHYHSATFTITPLQATVTAPTDTKVFGTADPVMFATGSNFLTTDDITFAFTRTPGEHAGQYSTTPTASGSALFNYDITYASGTFTITKGVVDVTGAAASKIYGNGDPGFTFNYGAMPGGLTSADIDNAPVCAVTVAHVNAGNYPVTCSGGFDNDVTFNYIDGTFTIDPRPATLVAGSGTKVFGTADPSMTASSPDLLAGDGAGITFTTTRPSGFENVGSYATTASASGGASGNYAFTVTPGTLLITKGTPSITVVGGTFVYNALARNATCTVTGADGSTLSGSLSYAPSAPIGAGPYTATCNFAGDANHFAASGSAPITITAKPITVTATNLTKLLGALDPVLTYTPTTLLGSDQFSGSLTRDAGESIGNYTIRQGTLTAGANYAITFVTGTLTILPVNVPPVALPDTATTTGAAPVYIPVLTNDTDLEHDALTVVSVTQPASGGTVTISGNQSGNQVLFTPTPGFVGTATFNYTVSDGHGGSATSTVVVTVNAAVCTLTGFTTYSQGAWGATPNGNNPAMLLQNKFAQVYPDGYVRIGGTKTLTFTSSTAIKNFLPAGGSPGVLTSTATNPTTTAAGVFAGQVLALQLNVDFSDAGITKHGFGDLEFHEYSVREILAAANDVLGGNTAILTQYGLSIADLNAIVEGIVTNFDGGTVNHGLLECPGDGTCSAITIPTTGNSSTSGTAGNIRTFASQGVSVKASAFARAKSNGAWTTAFLGAFSPGLGVTDGSEGTGADNKHKVDNVGDRVNYVLFEFSKPVIVTKAFLDYLGADSDAMVWVGSRNDPFNNHLTLSDALLASLASEENSSSATGSRWATFNGAATSGNVLVIAALPTGMNDEFKIGKLEFSACSTPNIPPTVAASNRTNNEGEAVSAPIVASDADGDTLTYAAAGLPDGLAINAATGLITGTVGYSASGAHSVTITVTDEDDATATATFTWTVNNTNRPPTVSASNRSDVKNTAVNVQITGSDPDGDTLTYSATGLPPGATMNGAGKITGTLTTAGTYTVNVTVKDSSNATGTGSFTWTVTSPNRPPDAVNDSASVAKGSSVSINAKANDSDPDGGPLTVFSTTQPSKGSVSILSNGNVRYTAPSNWKGTTTFQYTLKDSAGASDTATVTITVTDHHSGDGCSDHR